MPFRIKCPTKACEGINVISMDLLIVNDDNNHSWYKETPGNGVAGIVEANFIDRAFFATLSRTNHFNLINILNNVLKLFKNLLVYTSNL